MADLEYMSRSFVLLEESPPEYHWLRFRGPSIANFNLAGGPTTHAEIWPMRFDRRFRSLLIEIWLNEHREGWSVGIPFSHCLFFRFYVFYLLTPFSLSLGGYTGSRHRFSRWEMYVTSELRFHITVPLSCFDDTREMNLRQEDKGKVARETGGHDNGVARDPIYLAGGVCNGGYLFLCLTQKFSECWHCAQTRRGGHWAEIKDPIIRRMYLKGLHK